MSDQNNYDSIKTLLDLITKTLPKNKEQEKVLLITSIAGLLGIALVKVVSHFHNKKIEESN